MSVFSYTLFATLILSGRGTARTIDNDQEDHLADVLFADAGVDVEILREFGTPDDPYRVIECRIPRDQRDRFLGCIDLLPNVMVYVDRTDYCGW